MNKTHFGDRCQSPNVKVSGAVRDETFFERILKWSKRFYLLITFEFCDRYSTFNNYIAFKSLCSSGVVCCRLLLKQKSMLSAEETQRCVILVSVRALKDVPFLECLLKWSKRYNLLIPLELRATYDKFNNNIAFKSWVAAVSSGSRPTAGWRVPQRMYNKIAVFSNDANPIFNLLLLVAICFTYHTFKISIADIRHVCSGHHSCSRRVDSKWSKGSNLVNKSILLTYQVISLRPIFASVCVGWCVHVCMCLRVCIWVCEFVILGLINLLLVCFVLRGLGVGWGWRIYWLLTKLLLKCLCIN